MDDIIAKLRGLSVEESLENHVQKILLFPKQVETCECADSCSAEDYVKTCLHSVLAEYWGFLSKSTGNRPGWMRKLLKSVHIEVKIKRVSDEKPVERHVVAVSGGGDEDVKLEDLVWNLVIINGRLSILKAVYDEGGVVGALRIFPGIDLKDLDRKDEDTNCSRNEMFVLGYVRSYYMDMLAAMEFLANVKSIPPVLKSVAAPLSRQPFAYRVHEPMDVSRIGCNAVQESILRSMKTNIEGIQGPPGTGKSTTIFHILNSMIADAALVTCVQNKAVDSIAEKLATSSVPFVVFGRDANLGPAAVMHTIHAQVQRDPKVVAAAERLQKTNAICTRFEARLKAKENSRFGSGHEEYRRKLWDGIGEVRKAKYNRHSFIFSSSWRRWWKDYIANVTGLAQAVRLWEGRVIMEQSREMDAKNEARMSVMRTAKAALCTIDTVSVLFREDNTLVKKLTVAILDEAGTVPEYKMPVLAKLGIDAVIAIGDQKQLQPFSHVDDARKAPSGYFHRLARVLGSKLPMLKVQYRMHPQLCSIVSDAFYGGQLTTDPEIAKMREWVSGKGGGVSWVSYDDKHAETSGKTKSTSKWNPTEVGILENFFAKAGVNDLLYSGKSVMVISFYKEQTRALQKMAESYGYTPKDQRFRIVTVDAAQGSEADVVILSCVRSNSRGDIGFVENKNRMCVAISRARDKLIIVGDSKTFRRRPLWRGVCTQARLEASVVV